MILTKAKRVRDGQGGRALKQGVLYIHGMGGSADEAEHYAPLFPACDVVGFDYLAETPWEAAEEFPRFYDKFCAGYDAVRLIANSIGAFYAMSALGGREIVRAYLISPIADMEALIRDMMRRANVTEEELCEKGRIQTGFGEDLPWEYLNWVRSHPITWRAPTRVLYGSGDVMQSPDTIRAFAQRIGADLTVMENGEHWFHTPEQMAFLDRWIREAEH